MVATHSRQPDIAAWHPSVPGVSEVFHAHFTDHAYPMHAHDTWALLIVDDGAVRYDLDRHERGALQNLVTLLPPHVPHNGRSATSGGFRKRVIYLDADQIDQDLIGLAVDDPSFVDPVLRARIDAVHQTLMHPGDEFEAESRLALISERLRWHLQAQPELVEWRRDSSTAYRMMDLLIDRTVDGLSLQDASDILHCHPTHLVRAFSGAFGMAPHQYLTSRRVDLARRLLLDGVPQTEAAIGAGFYDQSHMTRHFKRILGTNPGRFATSQLRA
jgi:AraC-like DNA-binding protein